MANSTVRINQVRSSIGGITDFTAIPILVDSSASRADAFYISIGQEPLTIWAIGQLNPFQIYVSPLAKAGKNQITEFFIFRRIGRIVRIKTDVELIKILFMLLIITSDKLFRRNALPVRIDLNRCSMSVISTTVNYPLSGKP